MKQQGCCECAYHRAASRSALTSLTYVLDYDMRAVTCEGDAALARVGMRREDILGRTLDEFASPENLTATRQCVRNALAGTPTTLSLVSHGRDFVVQYAPARDDDGAIIGCVVIGRDVTDMLLEERARTAAHAAELEALAITDELTGLLNRRGFVTAARPLLAIAARAHRAALVFFADLNGLKSINDTHGHEAGDDAIRACGRLLVATFRAGDVVSRLGGDEFAVFAPDAVADIAASFRERLTRNIAVYNAAADLPWRLSVSVGVAPYAPGSGDTLEALLERSDSLMYFAKRKRREAGGSVRAMPAVSVTLRRSSRPPR